MAHELKAVLVGCGSISRMWLEALCNLPEIRLVGLVDLVEEQARTRAGEFGLEVSTGSSVKEMLRRTSPDAVFDCTVPEAHYEVTLTALAHGCHVLGEKPISDDMAQAEAMVAAATRSGKVYAVIQNRRFDPNIRRLKSFLGTGAIGKVTTLHADFFIGAHFGGFRERMRHVLLKDMAIHTFDAARFLTGEDPLAVYCHEWNPAGSWYDHGASAVAVFEMTNDLVFSYRGSWSAEGLRTSWESTWRIVGERGSVSWEGAGGLVCEVVAGTPGFLSTFTTVPIPPVTLENPHEGHAGVLYDFVRALRTGTTPETVATDNIKSLAMIFGAVRSAESRGRVEIAALKETL
jgi:predicted dehydrogenase